MEFSIEFILNAIVLSFLVITAIAAVAVRDLLVSILILGVFSLLMSLQYLLLKAPDVAITEAAVGAGLSTVLFLLALFAVGDKERKSKTINIVPMLVIAVIAAMLFYVTFEMPPFGAADAPAQLHVGPYYLHNAPSETGIPNMVTSILASYRGFDTLGEVAVVFTAIVSVMLLIGNLKRSKNSE